MSNRINRLDQSDSCIDRRTHKFKVETLKFNRGVKTLTILPDKQRLDLALRVFRDARERLHRRIHQHGIRSSAPAEIGTVHGLYSGPPQLRFDILEQVKKHVGLPLVLHGGTGIDDSDMIRLIRGGIQKTSLQSSR